MSIKSRAKRSVKRFYKRDWRGRFATTGSAKRTPKKRSKHNKVSPAMKARRKKSVQRNTAMRKKYGTAGHRTRKQTMANRRLISKSIGAGLVLSTGIIAYGLVGRQVSIKANRVASQRARKAAGKGFPRKNSKRYNTLSARNKRNVRKYHVRHPRKRYGGLHPLPRTMPPKFRPPQRVW